MAESRTGIPFGQQEAGGGGGVSRPKAEDEPTEAPTATREPSERQRAARDLRRAKHS